MSPSERADVVAGQGAAVTSRQPGPIEERLFKIEFLDPRVEASLFTFG